MVYLTNPACFHSYQRIPQLHTAPHHESARTSIPLHPRYPARAASAAMPLGRRILAWQVEQPHKPARSSVLLLLSAPIVGSPMMAVKSVANPANTLGGASTEMRDAERAILDARCLISVVSAPIAQQAKASEIVDVCNLRADVPATRAESDHRKRKADACPPLSHPTVPPAVLSHP